MSEKENEALEKHPFFDLERQLYYPSVRPPKIFDVSKLQLLAVVFVLLGLAGVYFLASTAPVPTVKIRDVQGNYLMNYATVYLEGNVAGITRVNEYPGGRLRVVFYITDESVNDTFSIFVYDPVASRMLKKGIIPFPGDHVKVLVQIRVREDFTYGILNDEEFLYIHREEVEPKDVYTLANVPENEYVRAKGVIRELRYVSSGILLDVDTGNDTITVLIPKVLDYVYTNDTEYLDIKTSLSVGAKVTISGVVYYYRGYSPEIVPRTKYDIKVEPIPEITLPEIPDYVGDTVRFQAVLGEVIEYSSATRSYVVNLYSDGYSVQAYISSYAFTSLDPFYQGVGSKAYFVGKVLDTDLIDIYDVEIVEGYPSPLLPISDVTEDIEGYTVAVKGIVVGKPMITGVVVFTIDDGTGSIKVFMPGSVYSQLDPARRDLISEGRELVLAGYVEIYRGELEIVVYNPVGIQYPTFIVPGEGYELPALGEMTPPTATTVSIGDLSNYVGSTVTINAYLDSIDYDSDLNMYVLKVHDDTGSCTVYASSEIVRSIIDPWTVGISSLLKITGSVDSASSMTTSSIEVVEAQSPPEVSVSEALGMELGTIIIIRNAEVIESKAIGSNWLLTVSDGSKSIDVFIPASVKEAIGSMPSIGSRVDIAGYLSEYRGEPEFVIYTPNGLKIVG